MEAKDDSYLKYLQGDYLNTNEKRILEGALGKMLEMVQNNPFMTERDRKEFMDWANKEMKNYEVELSKYKNNVIKGKADDFQSN